MKPHNPTFLSFDGESVTGRVPATLVVDGNDGVLTAQQEGGVARAYKIFCDAKRVSLIDYHLQHYVLSDGTTIQMTSIHGVDSVRVVPAPARSGKPLALAGYVLLPTDQNNTSGWTSLSGAPDSARAYLPSKKDAAQLHVKLKAGAVDWRSADGKTILSWDHNGNNRYRTCLWAQALASTGPVNGASSGIYYKGTKITTPSGVDAAAIFEGFLVYVSDQFSPSALLYATSPVAKIEAALAKGQFIAQVDPVWTVLYPSEPGGDWKIVSSWHFSPDGSKAACAVVTGNYVSDFGGGVGTTLWNLWRTRTTPLPQAKRVLTLAISAGVPTATMADTVYSGEEFFVKLNGTALDTGTTIPAGETPTYSGDITNLSVDLTFGGKRLLAIDHAADGTELLVEIQRSGTGTLNTSNLLSGDQDFKIAFTTKWGVYANGTPVFEANYNLPEIRYQHSGSTNIYSQSGGGTLLQEFVAMHELDARTLSAVVEKATVAMAGAMVDDMGGDHFADTAADFSMVQETYINGTLVKSAAETFRTAMLAAIQIHPVLEADKFIELLRYGGVQLMPNNSGLRVVQFPTSGNYGGDSWYEYEYQKSTASFRMTHNLVTSYPNQLCDFLRSLVGGYGLVAGFNWKFGWVPASMVYSGADSSLATFILDQMIALGKYTERSEHALAQRDEAPLEAVVQTHDWFLCQFEHVVTRVVDFVANSSFTLSGGYVEPLPVHAATHYLRPDTGTAWTQTDLKATVYTQVNAEVGGVDNGSFHLDPVRPL